LQHWQEQRWRQRRKLEGGEDEEGIHAAGFGFPSPANKVDIKGAGGIGDGPPDARALHALYAI
jgi:hypothetical protein